MNIVQKLRRARGWSQEQLAEKAEISRPTVQRIEAGKVRPNKNTAQRLAAAFGCDAVRIRESTALSMRLVRAMARINEGKRPDPKLLRRLPGRYRARFEAHCDARDEVFAAQAAFEGEVGRYGVALQNGEGAPALDAFFASSNRYQAALKKFGSTGNRVTTMLIRFCV